MTIMYKLVSQKMTSRNEMEWKIGKTNKALGEGVSLCSADLLHCYISPLQAVMFNPIHANFKNPKLLKIECSAILAEDGLKYGCKEQTPLEEIALPEITTIQLVAFAVKVALEVYKDPAFEEWADNWLSGKDRSIESAHANNAADAAEAARNTAAEAAAAYAAADAAHVAAYATHVAHAAYAAAAAAEAAADACNAKIDFEAILRAVIEEF